MTALNVAIISGEVYSEEVLEHRNVSVVPMLSSKQQEIKVCEMPISL